MKQNIGTNQLPSRLLSLYLLTLVILCLWPVASGAREAVDSLLYVLNRYIGPLCFLLILLLLIRNSSEALPTYWPTLVGGGSLLISALSNGHLDGVFIAATFTVIGAVLASSYWRKNGERFAEFIHLGFVLWLMIPLLLLIFRGGDGWQEYFGTSDYSYHGFADSRVVFGLIASLTLVAAVGLAHDRFVPNYLLVPMLIGIVYLSQSRAAVLATVIGAAYVVTQKKGYKNSSFLIRLAAYCLIGFIAISTWKLFGRQAPLELMDTNRREILHSYWELIRPDSATREAGVAHRKIPQSYWEGMHPLAFLVGAGGMVSVQLSSGAVTQAHNLIIQSFVNWGVIGLIGQGIYLLFFYRRLTATRAKGCFLVLLVYSMFQPIQGTANFFSPITLMIMMFIAFLDSQNRSEGSADHVYVKPNRL